MDIFQPIVADTNHRHPRELRPVSVHGDLAEIMAALSNPPAPVPVATEIISDLHGNTNVAPGEHTSFVNRNHSRQSLRELCAPIDTTTVQALNEDWIENVNDFKAAVNKALTDGIHVLELPGLNYKQISAELGQDVFEYIQVRFKEELGVSDLDQILTAADLEGADLRGVTIKLAKDSLPIFGINLADAILDDATLANVKFQNADLTGVSFKGSQSEGLQIIDSKCDGISFESATLDHALLEGLVFAEDKAAADHNPNFGAATFTNSTIEDCDFQQTFMDKMQFTAGAIINSKFESTNLVQAKIQNSVLRNADFVRSDLNSIDFSNSKFRDLRCQKSALAGAKFNQASFNDSLQISECRGTNVSFNQAGFNTGGSYVIADSDLESLSMRNVRAADGGQLVIRRSRINKMDATGAEIGNLSLEDGVEARALNLSSAILSGLEIRNSNCAGANFSNSQIKFSFSAKDSNLSLSNFTNSTIRHMACRDINLSQAILRNIVGLNCSRQFHFRNVDMTQTDLEGIDLGPNNAEGDFSTALAVIGNNVLLPEIKAKTLWQRMTDRLTHQWPLLD